MTASLRMEHVRLALQHLLEAAKAEPRAAEALRMAIHETGHALNAADAPWSEEHDPAAFMSTARAALALEPLREDSIRAAVRRHGSRAGIRIGANVLVRASWVAEQEALRSVLSRD